MGDALYFVATDAVHGFELWTTDGTSAGTRLVRDIVPGPDDSFPWPLVGAGDLLFFGAGLETRALWRSDGTAEGTFRLLAPEQVAGGNELDELTVVGDTLFFTAADPGTGVELWASDGSPEGTRLVREIRPGPEHAEPRRLTAVGGRLFFSAWTGSVGGDTAGPESGPELWTSDGTEDGTRPVGATLRPRGEQPRGLTDVDGTLFFLTAGGRIWASDGTADGTRLVTRVANARGGWVIGDGDMRAVGQTLYFVVDAGKRDELWTSDGTDAGTQRLRRFKSIGELTAADGALYFVADDGKTGREPWISDGTRDGTRLVKDVRIGKRGSKPRDLTRAGETIFFTANDGVSGLEVWATDGTETGTRLVRDIRPGRFGSRDIERLWFENAWLASLGDEMFFPAHDGVTGAELWVSDGTAEGTRLVADIDRVPVRDQGRIFGTGGIVDLGTDDWSQSITTGIAGQLTGIEFQIHTDHPGGVDYELALFAGDDPTSGAALFSERLTITNPREIEYLWDVRGADLSFDVGDVFTFTFSADQNGVELAGNDPPGYEAGELHKNGAALADTEANDLAFITYVLPEAPRPEATSEGEPAAVGSEED